MLLDRPYDSSIDWWQLGIITYQMLTRLSPYRGDDEDETYDSILADEPQFPTYMTMEAIDFIQNLLGKEPERRLGSGTNRPNQVMAHAFFSEINWDDLYHKRVPAPFIPRVVHRADASNFDSEITLLYTQAIVATPESMS
jgi:serine/threonine protein kinase